MEASSFYIIVLGLFVFLSFFLIVAWDEIRAYTKYLWDVFIRR